MGSTNGDRREHTQAVYTGSSQRTHMTTRKVEQSRIILTGSDENCDRQQFRQRLQSCLLYSMDTFSDNRTHSLTASHRAHKKIAHTTSTNEKTAHRTRAMT